ncbi:MAG: Uma2 family endonuclease [Chloroflexaceae bacterium]|nr:Uma2 family endonuclease [Chloroflexaceae bacterium]
MTQLTRLTQLTRMARPAVGEREPAPTGERRLRMSYEQFLEWSDEDTHAEWVNGEVIVFMTPVIRHQRINGFLYSLISRFADLFNLGEVVFAPFEMRHLPGYASREPDLLFVARENLHRLTRERLEGPADLVIEIVSPSSAKRDYQEKLAEYEQSGVGEYWVIDPRPEWEQVRVYQRTMEMEGCYQAVLPDPSGRYHSAALPGLWLRPEWLWREPLPAADEAMLEVCGEAYIRHLAERMRRERLSDQ